MKSAYTRYRNSILRQIRNQKKLGLDLNIELPLTERQLRQRGIKGAELSKETIRLKSSLPKLKGITQEARNEVRKITRTASIQQGHTNVNPPEEYTRTPRTRKELEAQAKKERQPLTEEQRQAISERLKQEWETGKRKGHKQTAEQTERFSQMARERAEISHEVAVIEREKEQARKDLEKDLRQQDRDIIKLRREEQEKYYSDVFGDLVHQQNLEEAREIRRQIREIEQAKERTKQELQELDETIYQRYRQEQETFYSDIFGDIIEQQKKEERSERAKRSWETRRRNQTREEMERNKNKSSFDYSSEDNIPDEDLIYFMRFSEWFNGFAQPLPDVPQFSSSIAYQGAVLNIVAQLVSEVGEAEIGRRLYENLGEQGLSECTETIQDPSASPNEKNTCSNRLMEALLDRDMTKEENEALTYQNEVLMYDNQPSL